MTTKRSNFFRRALALAICLLLAGVFSACAGESAYDIWLRDGNSGSYSEFLDSLKGKSAYELALIKDPAIGSESEWLASLKVGDTTLEELYEFYKTEHPDKTMDDFMSAFFKDARDPLQDAAQTALRSAVSLRARFGGTFSTSNTLAGSGVILSLDRETGVAVIITNYHVLYDSKVSENIRVCPYGKEYFGGAGTGAASLDLSVKATFIGGSVSKDIAILRTEANSMFKSPEYRAADIADSEQIVVGEAAIAVGNPEGVGISATRGIVNVDSEYISMKKIDTNSGSVSHRVIRIDAAINSGNSGGGLYNKDGRLIGIVNAKAVDEQIDNIGYAIPSNVAVGIANSVVDEVKEDGKFVKYLIGITTQITGSRAVLDERGVMRIREELEVSQVEPGRPSTAIAAVRDVLLSARLDRSLRAGGTVGGIGAGGTQEEDGDAEGGDSAGEIEITRNFTLSDYLYKARLGDRVILTVRRNGTEMTLNPITISSRSWTEI
ncbi:MAG: S1C family serine protease [Firmicutes bacterium]|nr:S1C family serine protease [Bacillota bacterium]